MPNRYEGRYGDYVSKLMAQMQQDPTKMAAAQERQSDSDRNASMFATAAPIVGAIGGGLVGSMGGPGGTMAGAGIGAQIGNSVGQAGGQAMSNQGQNVMDPIRRREMERQALLQAIMSAR